MEWKSLLLLPVILTASAAFGEGDPTIRIGMLASGTVNWEVTAARNEGFDQASGIAIEGIRLASPDAAKIALQGDAVDLIVTDWIWVAQQRAAGQADFTFIPYSAHQGVVLVRADAPIDSLVGLKGKRIGVAGGGLDKNWLLLRGVMMEKYGFDPETAAEPVFGAPPLLTEQLRLGRLDALLAYWHFAVKLEAEGYRRLVDGNALLESLGADPQMASLGFVFRERWARQRGEVLQSFLRAMNSARDALCSVDEIWGKVAFLTGEARPEIQQALRKGYCAGRSTVTGPVQQASAEKVWALLRRVDKEDHSSRLAGLPKGVFWETDMPKR
ncbi:MAG TPA: ABC transporter substrate-binding protein [Methylococcus sp.]|nr:ABC transporter substrate-binding protein [Methylococcus sp.]